MTGEVYQVEVSLKVPNVIQAATMDPSEYWVFDSAVAVALWLG